VGGGRGAAVITVLVPPGVVTPGGEAGRRARLDDGEQHHLRVRRAHDGERVALRDGAGLVGTGRIAIVGKAWEVEIESTERRARPAALTLAVGAGDRERFGWVVEKAGELGATRIVPLVTARAGDVASRVRDSHVERLRRQALEATKQCGAAWAVEVDEPAALAAFIERNESERNEPGLRWLADATGEAPPAALDGVAVTIVIGPEGGLEDQERATLLDAGFRPLALAAHTLRFETAALAAAAAVSAARLRGTHG
jgi:16S rRNA (uracil1498-N3)-methyltransferase